MNLLRTLDNEKLNKPIWGHIPQSLKQMAGRQDGDLVAFGLKPLINKVVFLSPFRFIEYRAVGWSHYKQEFKLFLFMGLNRLVLSTNPMPGWWYATK